MTSLESRGYGWEQCFTLLQRYGFAPRCILDVGANRGHWTRQALRYFPTAEFVLIEPQGHLRPQVEDLLASARNVRWIQAGVSDRPGRLPLTIAPDDTSSNFGMTAAAAQACGYTQTEVDVRTLDEVIATLGLPVPEMVKVDAEGFDLKVLAGARNLIGRTEIFFLEAAVCATGIENTMAAVIGRMAEYGYRMIDITDLNRSPKHGVLWLCEMAFMKADSPLLAQISSYR